MSLAGGNSSGGYVSVGKGNCRLSDLEAALRPGSPVADLTDLTSGIASSDPVRQDNCTRGLRKLLSKERNPPIQEVVDAKVVPHLVRFMQASERPKLQFEAAWALTNICSGWTENVKAVLDAGALPVFIQLLGSPSKDVQEQAAWAIGNIAGDGPDFRDQVLDEGAIIPLTKLLDSSEHIALLRNATWALSNLCRGKSPAPDFAKLAPSIQTLARLIQRNDEEVITDACWALSYMADGDNSRIERVVQADGICRRLVQLLTHKSTNVITPALRAVGNIVTGTDTQTEVMLRSHLTEGAASCSTSNSSSSSSSNSSSSSTTTSPSSGGEKDNNNSTSKSATSSSSTTTSTTANTSSSSAATTTTTPAAAAKELVVSLHVALERLLNNKATPGSIIKECCWTISNLTAGPHTHIQSVLDSALIPPLLRVLEEGDWKSKREATWAVANATSGGTTKQIQYLIDHGCVKPLCTVMASDDVKMTEVVLDALDNILRAWTDIARTENKDWESLLTSAGIGSLDKLLSPYIAHRDERIRELAVQLSQRYSAKWRNAVNERANVVASVASVLANSVAPGI